MTAFRHAVFAAISCACLTSAASAQDREPVTTRVRYADLNLASASGRAELKARIHGAAEIACPAMGGSLAEKVDAARCRQEMMKDGDQQIARLTNTGSQLALAERR